MLRLFVVTIPLQHTSSVTLSDPRLWKHFSQNWPSNGVTQQSQCWRRYQQAWVASSSATLGRRLLMKASKALPCPVEHSLESSNMFSKLENRRTATHVQGSSYAIAPLCGDAYNTERTRSSLSFRSHRVDECYPGATSSGVRYFSTALTTFARLFARACSSPCGAENKRVLRTWYVKR